MDRLDGEHVAHFYETRDEWRHVMVAWLGQGLIAGEKCVYVMNAGRDWMEAREGLAAAGVDIREALESGRLEIREGGRDPRELRSGFEAAIAGAPKSWKAVRWGGDMVWARDRVPSSGTLMSYESALNVHDEHPVAILCQYDLTRFPGYVIMDALRTHPSSIIDGRLHASPFHQPAAAFLETLPAREAARDVPW